MRSHQPSRTSFSGNTSSRASSLSSTSLPLGWSLLTISHPAVEPKQRWQRKQQVPCWWSWKPVDIPSRRSPTSWSFCNVDRQLKSSFLFCSVSSMRTSRLFLKVNSKMQHILLPQAIRATKLPYFLSRLERKCAFPECGEDAFLKKQQYSTFLQGDQIRAPSVGPKWKTFAITSALWDKNFGIVLRGTSSGLQSTPAKGPNDHRVL